MSDNIHRKRKKLKKPSLWAEHKGEIVFTFFALSAVHLPLLSQAYRIKVIDAGNAGQFGDFIGGYFGTLVLVVSVAFICASFLNQRRANAQSSFENRFFEMLKFHRENVSEIGIGSMMSGRRVFVSLIRECRECRRIIEEQSITLSVVRTREQNLDLAYLAFYYGVGPNSSRILKKITEHHPEPLVSAVVAELERIQKDYLETSEKMNDPMRSLEERTSLGFFRNTLTRVSYCPFDGHQSRLGHYYRHLFRMMEYVDGHAPGSREAVREYAGIVRAQLTNHEQALLCLNSLSRIGEDWRKTGILVDYEMIKNIPGDFFDPELELDIEKTFPEIEFEFKSGAEKREPNRSSVAPDSADLA